MRAGAAFIVSGGSMIDVAALFGLLAVLTVCAVITTATVAWAVLDLHRTLRRVDVLLPQADTALREAARALAHVRRALARTGHVSKQAESVAVQACDAMADAVRRFTQLKEHAQKSLGKWMGTNGHGAGAEPRAHS